jgi:hypothetical protein
VDVRDQQLSPGEHFVVEFNSHRAADVGRLDGLPGLIDDAGRDQPGDAVPGGLGR